METEGLAAFALFAARVLIMMRRGRVRRSLRWTMTKKLVEGFRFNPKVRYPAGVAVGAGSRA